MDLVDKYSYPALTYLLWRGKLPSKEESRMMEVLLSVCIEHSLSSPSVDAVRFVASCGVPLQTAVSAGVSAFGDWHGGAIEQAAKLLQDEIRTARGLERSLQTSAETIVSRYSQGKEKLPGYGHQTHTADPRTKKLLEVAHETKIRGDHVQLAEIIESLTDKYFRKHLILNVDGCIAAIISDMGFDWRIGKGFFIVSRAPGLVAHAYEQSYYDKPYKAPPWDEVVYTGPAERRIP
jgi:citrate synthase